jgi:predicted nucleotidyltransferase
MRLHNPKNSFSFTRVCYNKKENMALKQEIIEKIKECARSNEIDLVVLYGSQATGVVTSRSDIDLAVRSKKTKIDYKYFTKLLEEYTKIIGEKIDFVLINNAPPLLRRHISLYGKVLYEEKEGCFNNFKVESAHIYADTEKFRKENSLYVENFLKGVIPIVR